MNNQTLPAPNLIRQFLKIDGGYNRPYGAFICHHCNEEFETRMERMHKMTGLCLPCANKKGGRKRARFELGVTRSRLHDTWCNMKRRCINPQGKEKRIYAGIEICEDWKDFGKFMEWALANGYMEKMTIDRKDSSLGYNPDNCRFSDYCTQSANRKITDKNTSGYVGVTFQGNRWRASLSWQHKRIHIGRFKNIEDAVIARNKYIVDNNLPHTLNELKSSAVYPINPTTGRLSIELNTTI